MTQPPDWGDEGPGVDLARLHELVPATEETDIVEEVEVAGWFQFERDELRTISRELGLDLDVEDDAQPVPDPSVTLLADELGATVISDYERLDAEDSTDG